MNHNRRNIIRNSFIGGGLGKYWLTPAISSVIIPAHAQNSTEPDPVTEPEPLTCGGTLSDSDSFMDAELPVMSQTLSVSQFDGDTEALNRVIVTIRGRVYGDGQFENRQSSETDYTLNVDSQYNFQLPFNAPTTHNFSMNDSQEVSLPAFDGSLDFSGESSTNFDVDTGEQTQVYEFTDPADLAIFLGTGTIDFIVDVSGTFNAIGSSQQANATFLFAEGSVEIEYLCDV